MLLLGSCFAENMAEKFAHFNFLHLVNPFGILFHPPAIEKFLDYAVNGKEFSQPDIFHHNERWHCFDAHSELSSADPDELIINLQNAAISTRAFLAGTTHVVVTAGTAWVYRNSIGSLVANCHKVPQREFSKELLEVEAIDESFQNIIRLLKQSNPEIEIIFTVSPVRHIKDGFVENQRSKSHLIAGLHRALGSGAEKFASYFPAYEIMLDELRDYRFYADDMLHPSKQAIDYIWEKFTKAWVSAAAHEVMNDVAQVRKALAHRPFNPESESHRKFQEINRQKVESLQMRFPYMRFQ